MAERAPYGVVVPYLRAWRISYALSQSDLAKRSGVSKPAIVRAEGGARLSFANIRKVAECLGISVQQLLREDPNGTDQPTIANTAAHGTDPAQ
ncbi:MAG: helix-turn-helix domain-containing protein [Ktedonobacterales bacterium]